MIDVTCEMFSAALAHIGMGGRVVNIGGMVADVGPPSDQLCYALTKGALAAFTLRLVHDLGPRGITVNHVQPGPTVHDQTIPLETALRAMHVPSETLASARAADSSEAIP